MAKGYTDKTAVENFMLKSIDPAFNTQVTEWIEGVENTIDLITGRNFKADTDATVRYFDGDGEHELRIDDCVEITEVAIGQDNYGGIFQIIPATGADRFFTEPANHIAHKVPITKVVLNSYRFLTGRQNQKITAKWGYSVNVPADIKRAATIFVAGIINHNAPGANDVKSKRIGDWQVTYNTDNKGDAWADFDAAIAALDAYKRYHL